MLLAGGIGQPYVTTDYPAVQRALELDAYALLVAKHGVDGVYDRDPRRDPAATRYTQLTYEEALVGRVRVMDTSALAVVTWRVADWSHRPPAPEPCDQALRLRLVERVNDLNGDRCRRVCGAMSVWCL